MDGWGIAVLVSGLEEDGIVEHLKVGVFTCYLTTFTEVEALGLSFSRQIDWLIDGLIPYLVKITVMSSFYRFLRALFLNLVVRLVWSIYSRRVAM